MLNGPLCSPDFSPNENICSIMKPKTPHRKLGAVELLKSYVKHDSDNGWAHQFQDYGLLLKEGMLHSKHVSTMSPKP